ncbi:alpha-L-fucosidase [Aeoliella sp. SH292]|uniref:alpha-L-fucosidase n=1 Tax=Aeoliella sp. SH292 TaxID=3454464 RepID=UPI003F9C0D01
MNIVCKTLDRMLAVLALLAAYAVMMPAHAEEAPAPYGAVPSERQLDWHAQEYYAFLHFGPDTFTDEEWGWSQSTPDVFDPTELDTDQWARELKAAGMTGMILTAKHHDGMALWDTKTTEYRIGNSQWAAKRAAAGLDADVVRMAAESAKKHGLWFGIYLSPWDMHRDPAVPKPKLKGTKYEEPQLFGDASPGDYNDYYAAQLTELVTMKLSDGSTIDVREVWLDGASGSDTVQTFDWLRYRDIIREHQPHAIMWGHQGVDARWVGNEEGRAPETNWHTFDRTQDGQRATPEELEPGVRNGEYWTPAEADARLRSGWFYHASESPKSTDDLIDMYLVTVGRSVNLLLDVPPGPDGKLDASDITRLQEFRAARERLLGERLVDDKTQVRTSGTRAGNEQRFGGPNVVDGDSTTYWTMDDGERTGFVELDFAQPQRVTGVVAKEHIALGQRIGEYVIEAELDGAFETIAQGTSMGYQRIHLLEKPVETSRIRLRIAQADAVPVVSEFGALSASPERPTNGSNSAP